MHVSFAISHHPPSSKRVLDEMLRVKCSKKLATVPQNLMAQNGSFARMCSVMLVRLWHSTQPCSSYKAALEKLKMKWQVNWQIDHEKAHYQAMTQLGLLLVGPSSLAPKGKGCKCFFKQCSAYLFLKACGSLNRSRGRRRFWRLFLCLAFISRRLCSCFRGKTR